jgi:GH24 family phage-related lysozyme (muramidase)
MKLSKNGVDLIKNFEGFRNKAYKCPAGVWTAGFGSTGPDIGPNTVFTAEQAEARLQNDVKRFEDVVNNSVFVKLNQNEFDALVSFVYNVGPAAFRGSTLLKNLNEGADRTIVASEFPRWVRADGSVNQGLINRRQAEKSLFLTKPLHPLLSCSIIAQQDTWLKRQPVQSSTLPADQKLFVPKGSAHVWASITMVPGEVDYKVNLAAQPDSTWWFFPPHWKITNDPKPQPPSKPSAPAGALLLNIPYYSQRDNYRDPLRTCFSSACAMLLSGLKPNAIKNDNEYIAVVFRYGDTTNPSAQLEALEHFGVSASFLQNGSWADIDSQLDKGISVPIGILHKGPVTKPTGGGHWITIIGRSADRSAYIVHDPFGDLDLVRGMYLSANGKSLSYSKKNLGPRWMVEGGFTGWYIKATK